MAQGNSKNKASRTARRWYTDFDINMKNHPQTNDVVLKYDLQAVTRSIRNLILTNFYERPFHPELGCGIRGLLFENYSPLMSVFLKRKIEEVLINHEPRINLTSIVINDDDFQSRNANVDIEGVREVSSNIADHNRLEVEIHFNIIGEVMNQSVKVNLRRLR